MLLSRQAVHPELTYYYLLYFRRASGDSTACPDVPLKELAKQTQTLEIRYLIHRSQWMQAVMNTLVNRQIDHDLGQRFREAGSSYLRPASLFRNDSLVVACADLRQSEYLIAQAVYANSLPAFYSSVDYALIYRRKADTIRSTLLDGARNAITRSPEERFDFALGFLQVWYLFESSDHTPDADMLRIIPQLLAPRPIAEWFPRTSIGLFVCPNTIRPHVSQSFAIAGLNKPLSIDEHCNGVGIGLAVGKRFFLEEEFAPFSYIVANAAVVYLTTPRTFNTPEGYTQTLINGSTYTQNVLTRWSGSIKMNSYVGIFSDIGTVVLTFGDRGAIEGGVEIGASRTTLSLDYDYQFIVRHGNVVGGGLQMIDYVAYRSEGLATVQPATWELQLSPWVCFSVPISKSMSIEASFSFSNSFIGANFHL